MAKTKDGVGGVGGGERNDDFGTPKQLLFIGQNSNHLRTLRFME